jgi:1-acyl-sn-glycerol-3-phosphate acyltransferase
MKYIKAPFYILYRIWFYILVTIPILIMFPLLFISILKEKWYPYFFKLARIWAKVILFGMGYLIIIKKEQEFEKRKSYMLIANHTSMTDIMLMLYVVKDNPFVFVGKKELAKIPVFGFFYKRTCILVDRGNSRSKKAVFDLAQRRLDQGLSICIFPEGGVPSDRSLVLDDFKDGAFRLAIDYQIPIVPMSFYDNKKRFSYEFFSGGPGKMRTKIHKFVETSNKTQDDKKEIKNQCRQIIYHDLLKNQNA